jgi:hypothetical protein
MKTISKIYKNGNFKKHAKSRRISSGALRIRKTLIAIAFLH